MELISKKSFCEIVKISSVTFWKWKKKNKIQTTKKKGSKYDFIKIDKNVEKMLKEKILFKKEKL